MSERTYEQLETENKNLRCFLWMIINAAGGRVTLPKPELEKFDPAVSKLEFKTWLDSGDYFIEATKEQT